MVAPGRDAAVIVAGRRSGMVACFVGLVWFAFRMVGGGWLFHGGDDGVVCLLGVRVSLVRCALDGNEDSCVDYLLTYLLSYTVTLARVMCVMTIS